MVYTSRGVISTRPGGRLWTSVVVVVVVLMVVATGPFNTGSGGVAAVRYGARAMGRGVSTHTRISCEDDKLLLECQRGEVIRILNANYGRFTIAVCNAHGLTEGLNLQCRYRKSKEVISESCKSWQPLCPRLTDDILFSRTVCSQSDSVVIHFRCQEGGQITNGNNISNALDGMIDLVD